MKRTFWKKVHTIEPSRILLMGYLLVMGLGFLLLLFPFFQKETQSVLDHLFTAVSAVSTTGLSTVSVRDTYNLGGQIVVLLLIQIGGVGYMSVASFVILGSRKRISSFTSRLLRTDFSLGDSAELIGFVKGVIYFTLAIESFGALVLSFIFYNHGVEAPIWNGIFHSVSAFCTAGFSLFNNSFVDFASSTWFNFVIALLSLCGSIGFLVFVDVFQRLIGKTKKLAFTTKIILRFTLVLLAGALLAMLLLETGFEGKDSYTRFLLSFFQSMTALSTVGFNTYPIGNLSVSMLYIITVLMLIGASPAGTGGGIKSTTITAMYAVVKSTLMGERRVIFMRKEIPANRLRLAAANFFFYVTMLYFSILVLSYTEEQSIFSLMFEASSAIGTVGLSMGITGQLSTTGKLMVIFLMFVGRLGAATFGLALFKVKPESDSDSKEKTVQVEDVLI